MRRLLLVPALMAALFLGACDDDGDDSNAPQATTAADQQSGQGGGSASIPAGAGDVAEVAERVKPAVVSIANEDLQTDRFNQTFGVPRGVGSGVIFDGAGHILTNNHVVEGAERLRVTLTDGRTFGAELVGGDPRTDLAVLRIAGDDLPVAELGDSEGLVVGEWVVAIGNALGLPGGPTVTAGVVSALDRSVQEPGAQGQPGTFLFDLIQTDAAINPGNSGGPLIDLEGRVVGINTLVAAQGQGIPAQGIGFAIAINTARPIAEQLLQDGEVSHPYIGITYVPLNAVLAAQIGAPTSNGAVVVDVAPGSPADEAGLAPDDIITEVDGTELRGESALAQALFRLSPGDEVTLTVMRGDETMEVQVTLAEAPD